MSLFNYLFGDRPKVDARVDRPIEMPPAGPGGGSFNAPQIPQDRPISPIVQQAISDTINRVRERQGLPPAPQEENFLFYIEADPQLKQLIEQDMKNFHIQNSGTGI